MIYKDFVIALALILSSCQIRQTESPKPLTIDATIVRQEQQAVRQSFISTIEANYAATVQPRVNGYLAEKHFDNGMPVRKGRIIYRLDARQQQANVLAAQAALESARAKLIEAQNNYDRSVPLAALDAISQSQLDQYRAAYVAAEADVKSARQQLANANLELEYTTIRASIDGIISTSSAHVGDYVGPATAFTTLTKIENIDTICTNIAIPMRQYMLYTGRRAFTYDNADVLSDIVLYLADGSRYPLAGQYSFTRSAVSDAMGAIILVATFPNPDYRLKSGQFARIESNIGKPMEQIVIPLSALSQRQNIDAVWVIKADSTVEYRQIEVGDMRHTTCTVISGLDAGEHIALNSSLKLRNGMKVVPKYSTTDDE